MQNSNSDKILASREPKLDSGIWVLKKASKRSASWVLTEKKKNGIFSAAGDRSFTSDYFRNRKLVKPLGPRALD